MPVDSAWVATDFRVIEDTVCPAFVHSTGRNASKRCILQQDTDGSGGLALEGRDVAQQRFELRHA